MIACRVGLVFAYLVSENMVESVCRVTINIQQKTCFCSVNIDNNMTNSETNVVPQTGGTAEPFSRINIIKNLSTRFGIPVRGDLGDNENFWYLVTRAYQGERETSQ